MNSRRSELIWQIGLFVYAFVAAILSSLAHPFVVALLRHWP